MRQGDFAGRVVLVTGASRGIGYAVADGFLAAGAEVIVLAASDRIHQAASTLSEARGRPVRALACDIADRRAVDRALAALSSVDVLINNAGLEAITPIEDTDDEVADTFRRIVEINILGTYHVTRAVLPMMGDGGRIVLTSSIWGHTAVAEFSAYCATKHANIGFMRSLARELAPRTITVNAVCPGWVKTDAAMRSLTVMAERAGRPERELLADIVGAQALGGLMEPADVVSAYLYLASDAAGNITGQTLTVDRGEVMA